MSLLDTFEVAVRGKEATVTFEGTPFRGRVVSSGLSSEEGRPAVTLELVITMPKGPTKRFDAEFRP